MENKNYILISGSIFIFIVSIFFFKVGIEYKKNYDVSTIELVGLSQVNNINKLDISLKNLRGINQLDTIEANSLKSNLFLSEKNILNSIKKLNDKDFNNKYQKLRESKNHISNEELFNQYTKLLKILEHKRFNIADTHHLFFEADRDIYFLITTTIIHIPQAIENIAKIRGIGVALLCKTKKEDNKFYLKSNEHDFLQNVDNIKFILSKLNSYDSDSLNILLDSIVSNFHDINTMVKNIETSNIKPERYFLKTSHLVNKLNNLFKVSINLLRKKIELRQSRIQNELIMGILFYLLVLFISIYTIIINYKTKNIEAKISKKKRAEQQFINIIEETFKEDNTLSQICKISINLLIEKFAAINASLYLFNEGNKKLSLAATYGLERHSLKQTLELGENIISENILEKKINIRDINKSINIGNTNIDITKLLTLPLLEFNKSIGTIQLSFDNNFKNIDIEFLKYTITIISLHINKALQDDIAKKYLDLIDQNVLISQADLDGNITHVSQELCTLSLYTKEELIGKNHNIFRHEDMTNEFFVDLWATILQGITWRGEIKDRAKDGTYYWVDTIISPEKDINGNILRYTAIRTDISDRKKIEEIAITDALTSLYNRRHFDTMFTQQLEISKRSKKLLAFMLIDIDYFKLYNDTYGHQEGDTALKRVATALKRTLRRPDDYTFRLGGEEFGLLFYITSKDDGFAIAEIVRQNVEKLHIEHIENQASPFITISSGLSIINPNDINNADDIYKTTDEALYIAKKSGRNQTSIA